MVQSEQVAKHILADKSPTREQEVHKKEKQVKFMQLLSLVREAKRQNISYSFFQIKQSLNL